MTSQEAQVLIDAYLDASLSAAQSVELSAWIAADPAHADRVVLAAFLHRRIYDTFQAERSLQQHRTAPDGVNAPNSIRGDEARELQELARRHARQNQSKAAITQRSKPISLVSSTSRTKDSFFTGSRFSAWHIAALFFFIVTAVMTITSPTWTGWWRSTPVATLADAVDAQWDMSDAPQTRLDVGDHLPYGPLFLKSGYASIRLDNGVKLVIQGPAHFSVDSLMLAHLDEGKLTADVPHAATGYSVKIPSGMVIDIGTTFGVTAFANTESTVQVLKGSVQTQLFAADGKQSDKVVLTEDHAVALNPNIGTLASIPAEPDAYVTNIRSIPVILALHNTGQNFKPGDADSYWQITANTDAPNWTTKPAIVVEPLHDRVTPNPARLVWAQPEDAAVSQWLSATKDNPDMTVDCRLTFSTTLDLTGIDPDSVRLHLAILADNEIREVRLNGQVTPITLIEDHNHFYQKTSDMFDLNHGFVAGKNILEFVLANKPYSPGDPRPNPMGLRVELSGTAVRQETR